MVLLVLSSRNFEYLFVDLVFVIFILHLRLLSTYDAIFQHPRFKILLRALLLSSSKNFMSFLSPYINLIVINLKCKSQPLTNKKLTDIEYLCTYLGFGQFGTNLEECFGVVPCYIFFSELLLGLVTDSEVPVVYFDNLVLIPVNFVGIVPMCQLFLLIEPHVSSPLG